MFKGSKTVENSEPSPDYMDVWHGALPSAGEVLLLPTEHAYKYRAVWQRALAKINARRSVSSVGKEIQLFGSNTLGDDKSADRTRAEDIVKRVHSQTFVPVDNQHPSLYLFRPNTPFRVFWSLLYFLLMVYTALLMPFRLSFYDDNGTDEWFILEVVVNCLFFLDILLTLNTGFYDSEGTLIMQRKAIIRNYLRTWLIVDLVACVPFSAIFSSTDHNSMSGFLRFIRLARLYRLLRLARVFSVMSPNSHSRVLEYLHELVAFKLGSVRTLLVIMTFVLALHLMACLWFYVTVLESPSIDTWVIARNLQDSSVQDQYINSLYWAMTTLATVGYGDISPISSIEKLVAMVWMLFGVCFFSFAVSYLTNLINSLNIKDSVLNEKLAAIDEFAEEAKLAKDLRFRLRHAIRFSTLHTGFSGQVKRTLFNELPRPLRFEIAMSMHHGAVKEIPFFSERDQAFVASVAPLLSGLQVEGQTPIYQEEDYADEIYFIWKGGCAVMYEELVMSKLHKGAYFGEIEVILAISRKSTVQTIMRTDLLFLGKKALNLIQTDFLAIYEELREIAKLRDRLFEKAKIRFQALFSSRQRQSSPLRKRKKSTLMGPVKVASLSLEDRVGLLEATMDQVKKMITVMYEDHQASKGLGMDRVVLGTEGKPRKERNSTIPGEVVEDV